MNDTEKDKQPDSTAEDNEKQTGKKSKAEGDKAASTTPSVEMQDDDNLYEFPDDEDESAYFSDEESGTGLLETLQSENADLRDRLMRLMADMENLRRRTSREKDETSKYAISNFAKDVLKIGDNLSRALDSFRADEVEQTPGLETLVEGVQMTEREMINVLDRYGITRIDPKGDRFDPNLHQAMFEVPDETVSEGTIIQVVQAGYTIEDRVLRPAMVGVSKGGPKWDVEKGAKVSRNDADVSEEAKDNDNKGNEG